MGSIFIPVSILLLASVFDGGLILHRIVQIIIKPSIATESYAVVLFHTAAMLATQLNHLVLSKEIEVKAVIRLDKYICNIIQETRY